MKTTASLVKLLAFIVVTLLAFSVLVFTIANIRFAPTAQYRAVFTDATGLQAGDDVRIAGVRVGEVSDIAVYHRSQALVTFTADSDRVLPRAVQAVIRYRNLVGERYLALDQGPGDSARLPAGGTIPVSQTTPALDLTVLFNGFKPLFAALTPKDVNSLAYEVITVLQGEGGSINSLLAHTASLTSTLADRDQVIGHTIDSLNQVLGTVDARAGQLDQLIVQLQAFISGLAADREAIGASLTNIANLADSTAGLLKDARPSIKTDIAQLGGLATLLDKNRSTVDSFLKTWPGKLEKVSRTATYGSWFNFYLCSFDGRVVLPSGPLTAPAYNVNTARCSP